MTERRRGAPVVLAGVLGSGAAALAGNQDWWRAGGATARSQVAVSGTSAAPLVAALALVALAAWGVLLVTRGRVRVVVAAVAALACAGALLSLAASYDDLAALGIEQLTERGVRADGDPTAWYWLTAAGAAAGLAAALVAVRRAGSWATMSRRYDRPVGDVPAAASAQPETDRELWDRLDRERRGE